MRRAALLLFALALAAPLWPRARALALLSDGAAVPGNSFTTASVFAGVRQVQSGTVVSSGIGLVTDTLDEPVDPSRAFLLFSTSHANVGASDALVRGRLSSATTVEFGRVTNSTRPITISWYVVEYFSGVRVQRGEVLQTATTVSVPITPVAALEQAFVTWSKTPGALESGWTSDDPIVGALTAVDTLEFRAEAANATHRIWWEVVEFESASDIFVQTGSTSLVGGAAVATVPLPVGVDLMRSFVLVGYRTSGSGPDAGSRMLRARLLDANNLRIDRALSGNADDITEIAWQVVELNDGSTVQSGTASFATAASQSFVTLSAVSLTRSAAFASVQSGAGQSMGRSGVSTSATIGGGSATLTLTSPTQLLIDRDGLTAPADIAWFVVQFADL